MKAVEVFLANVGRRGRLMSALGVAALTMLGVPASGRPAADSAIAAPKEFAPTGHEQVYKVPSGVQMVGVNVVGGYGGNDDPQPPLASEIGAYGASLEGYLPTRPGETLYVEVGQNGTAGGGATFGGGGAAGTAPPGVPDCKLSGSDPSVPCSGPWAGSGGGASDIRTCSELVRSCPGGGPSVGSRLIVAAGGGGVGGLGLNGNGAGCQPYPGEAGGSAGGTGENEQLPTSSPNGPPAVVTARGIVIPGFAGGSVASVTTTRGATSAGMGTTAPGAGGARGRRRGDRLHCEHDVLFR